MKQNASAIVKTLHIRWVRSGTGFPRAQRQMVRSLGLRRLQQVVEVANTPSVQGLLARVPHLVEIVHPQLPANLPGPEYIIRPPERAVLQPPSGEPHTAHPVEAGGGGLARAREERIEGSLEPSEASDELGSGSALDVNREETGEEPDEGGEKE